jgi:glycosyltransferase involved in cell wall biosynthesis
LTETIDSVLSVLKNRKDAEIIIVDNMSTDLTPSIAGSYCLNSIIKYFLETKQGLSHARNRGMEESSGEILVYLDDDIELVDNYFEIADSILSDTSISVLGGKVLPFKIDLPTWLPQKFYFLVSIFNEGEFPKDINYVMGANFIVRRVIFDKIGGFNTFLGRKGNSLSGGEEIDFLNRVHLLKSRVYYMPNLIVYHKIDSKLNQNYVLTYSKELGKSERFMDESISKVRVLKKITKSYAAILMSILLSGFLKEGKRSNYLRIIYEYGKGYVGSKF